MNKYFTDFVAKLTYVDTFMKRRNAIVHFTLLF